MNRLWLKKNLTETNFVRFIHVHHHKHIQKRAAMAIGILSLLR